ncbi:MAG: hypothetical protein AB7S81_04955 [Bdellovibrionales bacterium]
MTDRGDKIINLAQEMLKRGTLDAQTQLTASTRKKSDSKIIICTACFAALLAASASATVTRIFYEFSRPANYYERTEIDALLFYTARELSVDQPVLRHELQADLGIHLSRNGYSVADYKRARDYLQNKLLQTEKGE